MTEAEYQEKLRKKIEKRFPGVMILKNDPNYIQGIPDLMVIYGQKWAALEVKLDENAKHRPNQDFYIQKMNDMGFAAFIFPQNEKEIIDAMERSFKA